MSPETLQLLKELLDGLQMQVGHPDFESRAQQVITAKRELDEAIEQSSKGRG